MSEIGRMLDVKTPMMDALITLASAGNGIDYRAQGLTREKLGLANIDPEKLTTILQNGF